VLKVDGGPERASSFLGANFIVVTLYKPDGPGPFPLAIYNHGANGDTVNPGAQPRARQNFLVYYFLSRGYAVALPMMRGYSGSTGGLQTQQSLNLRQYNDNCNYTEDGLDSAKDIKTTIDYLATQSDIDTKQIIVTGQSFGGFNTLAVGALGLDNVKVLFNFAGGMNGGKCSETAIQEEVNKAARYFGAHTKAPSLWFYGENDHIIPVETWMALFDNYTAAGGPAYLAEQGIPVKILHPEYMPLPFPKPSNFAAIDNIEAVPYLSAGSRELFRKYRDLERPKVFLIDKSGHALSYSHTIDPVGMGLKACEKRGLNCEVYAVDNDVVWTAPK
jgi:dienelactone hydrolase